VKNTIMQICLFLAVACVTPLGRIEARELELSVTSVHSASIARQKTLPHTLEECIQFNVAVSGLTVDKERSGNFRIIRNIYKVTNGTELVSTKTHVEKFDLSYLHSDFFAVKYNYLFGKADLLGGGDYISEIIIEDLISGKKASEKTSFSVLEKNEFRLLDLTLATVSGSIKPITYTFLPFTLVFRLSEITEADDEVYITLSYKDTSEVIRRMRLKQPKDPQVLPLRLCRPGQHTILLTAENVTKKLKLEYKIPVVIVNREDFLSTSIPNQSEELEITIIPVYPKHWLYRNTPWCVGESMYFQSFASGLTFNEESSSRLLVTYKMKINGELHEVRANAHSFSEADERYPLGEQAMTSTHFLARPGKYEFELSVWDRVAKKTVSRTFTFDVRDTDVFRLRNIRFRDPLHELQTTWDLQTILWDSISLASSGDIISIVITDKESSKIITDKEFIYDESGNNNNIVFSIPDPGKHILVVTAENKTKKLRVQYEMPVFLINIEKLHNPQYTAFQI